jgi:hypothetical protein
MAHPLSNFFLEGSERQTYNMHGYDGVHYSGNVAFISE